MGGCRRIKVLWISKVRGFVSRRADAGGGLGGDATVGGTDNVCSVVDVVWLREGAVVLLSRPCKTKVMWRIWFRYVVGLRLDGTCSGKV